LTIDCQLEVPAVKQSVFMQGPGEELSQLSRKLQNPASAIGVLPSAIKMMARQVRVIEF
jgi:hypothetical protein